ncbi:MAG TPA: Na-translocating system protein MpsC family protein [Solirubrobacteraceae bacterium]|nr:Na-translocating system protein MpsC family protein [Solirubrobacteraceae bacterium]
MADSGQLAGGELNAAITSALVGIHHEYLGRGPETASTFHHGNVLVTLMHEVLTHAEKSLTQNGQSGAVDHIRRLFQETMEADFREAVERLTGRKVLAFISGNHIDPDIATELFILDGTPGRPDPGA